MTPVLSLVLGTYSSRGRKEYFASLREKAAVRLLAGIGENDIDVQCPGYGGEFSAWYLAIKLGGTGEPTQLMVADQGRNVGVAELKFSAGLKSTR